MVCLGYLTNSFLLTFDQFDSQSLTLFMYALKAPQSKRQYPRRFKVFLDFLKIPGDLDSQAKKFLSEAKANPTWAQDRFMRFIMYQIERAKSGEIS